MKILLSDLNLHTPFQLFANQDGGDKKGPPTFSGVAYTGAVMQPKGYKIPVVIELSGVKTRNGNGKVSILLEHDHSKLLGQGKIRIEASEVLVDGTITGENEAAKDVIAHSKNGFAWELSVGGDVKKTKRLLNASQTMVVNGKTHKGPLIVIQEIMIDEVTVTKDGADNTTSLAIAASYHKFKEHDMNFEEWLKSINLDLATLSDDAVASLQGIFDSLPSEADSDDSDSADDSATDDSVAATDAKAEPKAEPVAASKGVSIDDLRAAMAADKKETKEHNKNIRLLCSQHGFEKFADVAIAADMDENETLKGLLKATRENYTSYVAPNSPEGNNAVKFSDVLECAMLQTAGYSPKDGEYSDRVLEAARGYQGTTLHRVLYEAAKAGGNPISPMGMNDQKIRAAFDSNKGMTRLEASSSLSTVNIAGITSNVANKFLLQAYQAVESQIPAVCKVSSTGDFKQTSTYRLIDNGSLPLIAPGGEVTHGTLTEQTFNNQVSTYGKMISTSRNDLINDDLGALTSVSSNLGRASFNGREKIVFDLLTAALAAGFFSDANGNLISAAPAAPYDNLNPLSFAGLSLAERRLMEQTDGSTENNPIALMGAFIICGPALSVVANQLFASVNLNETTTADAGVGESNVFAGKYRPAVTPFLSGVDWYLGTNPNSGVAGMEIVYLNGQQNPTIDSSDLDFNQLGIQTKVIFDFGVAMMDEAALVLSDGD